MISLVLCLILLGVLLAVVPMEPKIKNLVVVIIIVAVVLVALEWLGVFPGWGSVRKHICVGVVDRFLA